MASIKFCVPAYPNFQRGLDVQERHRFDVYMKDFRTFATTALRAQTMVAREAIEKGDLSAGVAEMRNVARDFTAKAYACVERVSECSESEVNASRVAYVGELAKLTQGLRGALEQCAGSSSGDESEDGVASVGPSVGPKTLVNREKRRKNRVRKLRKQEAQGLASGEEEVPEWRRKAPRALEHKGFFSGCARDVQEELVNTRAKMLSERNRAETAKVKLERVRAEARVKSRVVELEVDAQRMKLDAERKKAVEARLKELPAGFAETLVSVGVQSSVPSLESGSVSPDSSISVAEVERMEKAIETLTSTLTELRVRSDAEVACLREEFVKEKAAGLVRVQELEKELTAFRCGGRGARAGGYSSWV